MRLHDYAGHLCGKAAEESLAEAASALRKSETRYRTVFQTSRDALGISRLSDGTYLEVNQAFLQLFGFEREELIGKMPRARLGIWPNMKDRDNFAQTLRQNSSSRDDKCQLRKKNGEIFWG